jgi:hypothetical protein
MLINIGFWVKCSFILKHDIKNSFLVNSTVKKLKRKVIYIQCLKDMENAAVPLFWKTTEIDSPINI